MKLGKIISIFSIKIAKTEKLSRSSCVIFSTKNSGFFVIPRKKLPSNCFQTAKEQWFKHKQSIHWLGFYCLVTFAFYALVSDEFSLHETVWLHKSENTVLFH